jgi:hypothetical protein
VVLILQFLMLITTRFKSTCSRHQTMESVYLVVCWFRVYFTRRWIPSDSTYRFGIGSTRVRLGPSTNILLVMINITFFWTLLTTAFSIYLHGLLVILNYLVSLHNYRYVLFKYLVGHIAMQILKHR